MGPNKEKTGLRKYIEISFKEEYPGEKWDGDGPSWYFETIKSRRFRIFLGKCYGKWVCTFAFWFIGFGYAY